MKLFRIILLFATAVASAGASERTELAAEESPTAQFLFDVFVELRTTMEADPAGVARFLSRHWLEEAIASAFRAAQVPKTDGLDWVFDSLQSSLSIGSSIEQVYGYRLVGPSATSVELEMNVASCRGPFVYTLTFQEEDGQWRVIASASDGTDNAKSWYEPTLQPVWRFERIEARDRSRYFNESPLGEAFNLNVKYKPCPE